MRTVKEFRTVDDALDRRLKRALSAEDNSSNVDAILHRRVMNRVSRSAEPAPRPLSSLTLAAGALAVLVAFVGAMMIQSPVNPAATEAATGIAPPVASTTLRQHLARLESAPVLPEAALRQEYERLKSDLRKLGIET